MIDFDFSMLYCKRCDTRTCSACKKEIEKMYASQIVIRTLFYVCLCVEAHGFDFEGVFQHFVLVIIVVIDFLGDPLLVIEHQDARGGEPRLYRCDECGPLREGSEPKMVNHQS